MTDLAPVQEQSRIKSLDVVRGFALLGILPVNAAFFAAPFQAAQNPLLAPIAIDASSLWSWLVMHVLFEFKMITLFSMLFGASIYLVGGERSDKGRGAVLHRRHADFAQAAVEPLEVRVEPVGASAVDRQHFVDAVPEQEAAVEWRDVRLRQRQQATIQPDQR